MTARLSDRLAFDRASVRTIDPDSGHMHVSVSNISKAMVCPYYGREIPRAAELGLAANKVYMLLRDPGEMEKAAGTFEGKPLMDTHKPQSADDHDHEITVGAVSNVRWNAPFLQASLAVWDGESIEDINSEKKAQLSSGYFYDADMTPGVFEGVRFDGRMINLRGNHVSFVEEGRAGPDVCVGDAALATSSQPPSKERAPWRSLSPARPPSRWARFRFT